MIRPHLRDDAFLADVEAATESQPDALHLWWLGQSGYLVAWNGTRIVLDPYLSDSLTRKYAATDKPHVRMTERVIAPERLTGVALVTSSHNHTDHLDAETLVPLLAANPDAALVFPEANRAFVAERLGGLPASAIGLDDGTEAHVGEIGVRGVAAAHEGLDVDADGRHVYLGFVVTLGPWTLYHSGDTVLYDGMVERLAPPGVDVALLPVNGRAPERRVSGNLRGDEAAQLAKAIGAGVAIPCHYEMFTFNTEPPDLFVRTCQTLGQPFAVLRGGERWTGRK